MENTNYKPNISNKPIDLLRELLLELRIDDSHLEAMADGWSPHIDGIQNVSPRCPDNLAILPKIQLSQRLASDIYQLDIRWKNYFESDL